MLSHVYICAYNRRDVKHKKAKERKSNKLSSRGNRLKKKKKTNGEDELVFMPSSR